MVKLFLFLMTILCIGIFISIHLLMGGTMSEVEMWIFHQIQSFVEGIKNLLGL